MHIGTTIVQIGFTSPQEYYTPWFPKGGDYAYFMCELIHQNLGSGGTVTITAYTKNAEDAGSQLGSGFAFSQWEAGFWEAKGTDLKQLVRFKITVSWGEDSSGPMALCYRFLPPTWYNKAV